MLASFLKDQNEAQLRVTIRDSGRVGSPGTDGTRTRDEPAGLRLLDSPQDLAGPGGRVGVDEPDRPAGRRSEEARWWVLRMRWMPRTAAAMTSSRLSPARLASSTALSWT